MTRASGVDGKSPIGGGASTGTSLTAVRLLLAFLNVSQVVARGSAAAAEGNRGLGLTVMGVNPPEGGGAVVDAVEGNGIFVEGVTPDLRRSVPGGCASPFREGRAADGAACADSSRLGESLSGRCVEAAARKGSETEASWGRPSTASATRRKSRRAARHSFSFFESKAQSPASVGTPRAVQNIVFLHKVGSLVNICIVRSLRENRILIVDVVALADIVAVVDRGFVLISISARGSFAMRVHTKSLSYIMT
jgi:hypothetical protein